MDLLDNRRFELLVHDVTLPLDVKVDQIYNLACPASPVHYQMDPVKTIQTSILGAINMLELARKYQARIKVGKQKTFGTFKHRSMIDFFQVDILTRRNRHITALMPKYRNRSAPVVCRVLKFQH